MNTWSFLVVTATSLAAVILAACGADTRIDVERVLSEPKAFVGSDNCKMCHLEHYDS